MIFLVAENGGLLGSDEIGGHFEEVGLEIGRSDVSRATYMHQDGHLCAGDAGYVNRCFAGCFEAVFKLIR